MLSRRIARTTSLRPLAWAVATRRLPVIQHRTFLPPSINSPEVNDEKYPDPVELTEAEDPGMVRLAVEDQRRMEAASTNAEVRMEVT